MNKRNLYRKSHTVKKMIGMLMVTACDNHIRFTEDNITHKPAFITREIRIKEALYTLAI